MAKIKTAIPNKFKAAVLATPDIMNCYCSGLGALGKYSVKIKLLSKCDGSVDIDTCVTAKYPSENRWDYTFGYKAEAYFVEVHSANTSEVSVVLRKLQWLKTWLHNEAPRLNTIKAKKNTFIWLSSGKYNILKGSSQHRKIIQAGMNPMSSLNLS